MAADPTALLGLPASDPGVVALLAQMKVGRQPSVTIDESGDEPVFETQDWLLNRYFGLELGFEDAASFRGDHPDELGTGEMLLTQIYFYGLHDEVQPYQGRFPMGLALADGRDNVRARLAQWDASRRSWIRDCWEFPPYRMTVSYAEQGACIGFVLCALRPPRQEADPDDARRVPDIARLVAMLGTPLRDPAQRLLLAPLRLEDNLEDDGSGALLADYSLSLGLELQYEHIGGGRDPSLARIRLLGFENLDAVAWPGRLPFDMTFYDAPDAFARLVGRMPDEMEEIEDGSFTGYAIWHLEDFTLQIEFNTMYNLIFRVQLVALGAWADNA